MCFISSLSLARRGPEGGCGIKKTPAALKGTTCTSASRRTRCENARLTLAASPRGRGPRGFFFSLSFPRELQSQLLLGFFLASPEVPVRAADHRLALEPWVRWLRRTVFFRGNDFFASRPWGEPIRGFSVSMLLHCPSPPRQNTLVAKAKLAKKLPNNPTTATVRVPCVVGFFSSFSFFLG